MFLVRAFSEGFRFAEAHSRPSRTSKMELYDAFQTELSAVNYFVFRKNLHRCPAGL